jgi:hypothetical protein
VDLEIREDVIPWVFQICLLQMKGGRRLMSNRYLAHLRSAISWKHWAAFSKVRTRPRKNSFGWQGEHFFVTNIFDPTSGFFRNYLQQKVFLCLPESYKTWNCLSLYLRSEFCSVRHWSLSSNPKFRCFSRTNWAAKSTNEKGEIPRYSST